MVGILLPRSGSNSGLRRSSGDLPLLQRHNREEQIPSVAEFVGPLAERLPEGVTPILEPGR